MTRISCLESVALAAKEVIGALTPEDLARPDCITKEGKLLMQALNALDACPQAEPVEGRPERPINWISETSIEGRRFVRLDEAESRIEQLETRLESQRLHIECFMCISNDLGLDKEDANGTTSASPEVVEKAVKDLLIKCDALERSKP